MIGPAVRHTSSVAVIRRERYKPTANAGSAPGDGHKVGKGTMILLPSHSPGVCRDHAMRAARREPRRGESPMSAEEQVCRLMNFPGNRGSLSGVSGTNRKKMNERNSLFEVKSFAQSIRGRLLEHAYRLELKGPDLRTYTPDVP